MDDARREQQAIEPACTRPPRKVLDTLDREWDGLARHRDFPDIDLDNNASRESAA